MKIYPNKTVVLCAWMVSATLVHGQDILLDLDHPVNMKEVYKKNPGPYRGPVVKGVNRDTLTHKVMSGYQMWFRTPGDGYGKWVHWQLKGSQPPGDGNLKVDMWPDTSEMDGDEKEPTTLKLADGSPAVLFSSVNPKTVLRHFRWMQEYGIDGVFKQVFVNPLDRNPEKNIDAHIALALCREGANRTGRTYAVMYDVSSVKDGDIDKLMNDWKFLIDHMQITADPAYQRHRGKPVVSIWGLGFANRDKPHPGFDDCMKVVDFLKNDPKYGGMTVMLGCPTGWRTLSRDADTDERFSQLYLAADILSPWTVGRFKNVEEFDHHLKSYVREDLEWCRQNGKDYYPVVYPGFSWHNMKPTSMIDAIPREEGRFMWHQFAELKKAGIDMIYQAMFDEVDEATAIFKVSPNPPVGEVSKFLTYGDLGTDFYLKLVGAMGKVLRGEVPLTEKVPAR